MYCEHSVKWYRYSYPDEFKEEIQRIVTNHFISYAQAESELRISQAEFDKQVEITKLLMDGLKAIQTNHLRHLKAFVETQAEYYANCHQIMQDLQKELAR